MSSLKNHLVGSSETMSQSCEVSVLCLVPARPSFSSWNRCISAGPGLHLRRKTGHKHLFPLSVIPATHKAPSPLARPCCRTVRETGGGFGTCVFSCVWPDRGGKPEGQCEAPDRWKKEQLFWLSFTLQMWSNVIMSHPNTVKLQNILKPQEPVRYESVWIHQTLLHLLV